jgi:UrcA family protein
MKVLNMKSSAGLAVIGMMIATSGQVLADQRAGPPPLESAVTVDFADLNVAAPAGARILYTRIRSAAKEVCGPSFAIGDARRSRQWRECYDKAVDTAVLQVDRPMLSALHGQPLHIAPVALR